MRLAVVRPTDAPDDSHLHAGRQHDIVTADTQHDGLASHHHGHNVDAGDNRKRGAADIICPTKPNSADCVPSHHTADSGCIGRNYRPSGPDDNDPADP